MLVALRSLKLWSADDRHANAIAVLVVDHLAGLALIAGPWIGILTAKYGRLTYSTAGSPNHANMSPENYDRDPLWNPGLVPDFISDPRLIPDWSPFQDAEHLLHQLKLVGEALRATAPFKLDAL